ncbi:MAG: IS110 family transposase [Thermoleophilaceae bacterium]
MIVIGADTHKSTHTCAAAKAGTGELAGEKTAAARKPGFRELLDWGRGLNQERIWALEDCRHVSGSFERFLVDHGERVVRVAPKLMGESRKAERTRGKSDPIDALAIARAALKEGPETLPGAHLDGDALELKLLLDHREDIVRARSEDQQRLRWHLHDLWPELQVPAGALDRLIWLKRIARRLARAEQTARIRIARELVSQIRRQTRQAAELEREITTMVGEQAPQLLELAGCGALTAAKLIGETAGVERFASDAKLARLSGVAPIPASSGRRDRHRLDRRGNRQLNCALHRIAVTQGRVHPPARDYLARKQAEGKSRMEALRCLKRHLARAVWQALRAARSTESINSLSQLTDSPKLRPAADLALT